MGLSSFVSEIPTIVPLLLFTGHATALFVPGPPRAPKSIICGPATHKAACETLSPCWFANPETQPRSLMPLPLPFNPPSVSSGTILYLVCEVCEGRRTAKIANAASKAIRAMHVDILKFMLPPHCGSLSEVEGLRCRARFSCALLADAGIQSGVVNRIRVQARDRATE